MDETQYLDPEQDPILEMYRKLREANRSPEESSTPVTQTIKIDPATGEQTMTIKGSPRDLSSANPLTPTISQPGPVSPTAYNQFIAQKESGGNPNIGYHNLDKSTAYGSYGITAPSYQDIQKNNPAFANRPITSLSPEEQNQAMNTYTAQNAKYLQSYGVEPTPGNLAGAHFLGARGLSDYLKSGTISPQAAAANGGEDRVRQILAQRMTGAPGGGTAQAARPSMQPVSAPATNQQELRNDQGQLVGSETPAQIMSAVQPTGQAQGPGTDLMDPEGWAERFAGAQRDPKMVAEMAFDKNAPKWVRGVAEQHLGNFVDQKRAEQAAQELFAKAQETGDFKPVMREAQRSGSEGSWVKYMLFQAMHLTAAADLEASKLGLGNKTIASTGPGGERGLITYDSRGNPVSGVRSDGTAISGTQLLDWASGQGNKTVAAQGPKGEAGMITLDAQGAPIRGVRADGTPITGNELIAWAAQGPYSQTNRYSSTEGIHLVPGTGQQVVKVFDNRTGKTFWQDVATGDKYTGRAIPKPQSIETSAVKEENRQAIQGQWVGPNASNRAAGAYIGEFNQKNGTNIGIRQVSPGVSEYIDLNTNRPAVDANGNFAVTPGVSQARPVAPSQLPPAQAPNQAAPAPATNAPETSLSKLPKPPVMERGESPAAFTAREKAWSETYGKQYDQTVKNTKIIQNILPDINKMKDLIAKSTSSGLGSNVDSVGNWLGYSTEGATAIAAIAPLANQILMGVQRFEGPQSDRDVASYKEASGKLADPTVPAAQKQAAFNTIIEIMKRNAPELDWASIENPASKTKTGVPYKVIR